MNTYHITCGIQHIKHNIEHIRYDRITQNKPMINRTVRWWRKNLGILFACGSNPFEYNKAVITARMLSGRYPTDKLQRHWSQNQSGFCLLPECAQSESLGTLEHLLLYCTALKNTRRTLLKLAYEVASESPHLYSTLLNTLLSGKETEIMQMLLDCTTMPSIISLTQLVGPATRDRLLYFGRTWCYTVHRERMKQIGLFCYR